jgi:hypothetical protein
MYISADSEFNATTLLLEEQVFLFLGFSLFIALYQP